MSDAPSRTLVIVRHAKARSGEEGSDHDRRLTGRGQAAATDAGRWLSDHAPAPDLVLCSSAARARQTWKRMASSVRSGEVRVERALYLAGPQDVLDEVRSAAVPTTVVVGHNPTMEEVLAAVTGGLRGMRPGAVAVVDLDAGHLVDFWEPAR